MKRAKVESDFIVSRGYDPAALAAEVEFKDGSVYRLEDFTADLWDDWLAAPSAGEFYNMWLRNWAKGRRLKASTAN